MIVSTKKEKAVEDIRGAGETMDGLNAASLFKAIEISDYDIHPDGRRAICSVNRGRNWELAVLDLKTGALKSLLAENQSLMSPTFSPDGESIVFHKDFEGNENHDVVVVGSDGKRQRKLTDGVEDNFSPEFSPDGSRIAFLSNRDDDIENIFVMSSKGGKITMLTDEDLPVRQFSWSPTGRAIAYQVGIGDNDYVSLVDPDRKKARRVLSKSNVEHGLGGDYGGPAPWSPDGERLLFISNENDSVDIGELAVGSGRTKWLVKSGNEKYSPKWSADGDKLAYLEIEDPDLLAMVRSKKGTSVVSPRDGTSRAIKWLPDGTGLVLVNGSAVRPEEVFVARTTSRRVTKFQSTPLQTRLFAYPKLVRFRSFDGLEIPALLYLPKDRSRRAGIVLPHGGPEMQDTNAWDQLTLMIVDKGFSVIKPNYRGSTGYGRKYLHLHDKDLGGGDYLDTVYAGKFLLDNGYAAKNRLGYWGASYSGYTAMMAMTKHPDMWAAGVSIVGFFDWVTEHESERGYLKAYDESKMGNFSKNKEFFAKRSPINFLGELKAPLLMTASAKDVRCPPTESRAVVRELKRLGKVFEYHEYQDEGHWPRKRKNLKDLYSRSTRFLDKHIAK